MHRFAVVFVVALLMVGSAHADNNKIKSGMVMSRMAICGPVFSCADATAGKVHDLPSRATKCVENNFGMSAPLDGFFEPSGVLDRDNCLTTATLPRGNTGLTMMPLCCVVPVYQDSCQFHCTKYGVPQ